MTDEKDIVCRLHNFDLGNIVVLFLEAAKEIQQLRVRLLANKIAPALTDAERTPQTHTTPGEGSVHGEGIEPERLA